MKSTILDKFKDDPYIDVIKLHYFEDKTYNQIAEIFDHKFGKKDKLTAPATIGRAVPRSFWTFLWT